MFYYVEPIIPWEPQVLGSQRQVASALPFSIYRFKVHNAIVISCVSLLCVPLGIYLGSFLDRESLYSFYAAHFILSMGVPVPGQPFVLQLRSFERNLLDDRSLCDLPFIALQHHDSAELLLKYHEVLVPVLPLKRCFNDESECP
jgi:hypothetical protein